MCHSATARPTHGVVVGRAVLVSWNPPAATQSKTFHGFCASCSFLCTGGTATASCGWVGHPRGGLVGGPWHVQTSSERRMPSKAGTPRPWQGAAVGRFGNNAPPLRKSMTQTEVACIWWVASSHRSEGRSWWAAPRA